MFGLGDAIKTCGTHIEGRHGGPCSSACGPRRGGRDSLQIAPTSIVVLLTIAALHTELGAAHRPAGREAREVGRALGAIECCKEAIAEYGERAFGPCPTYMYDPYNETPESAPQKGCQCVTSGCTVCSWTDGSALYGIAGQGPLASVLLGNVRDPGDR